ncbi:MAG TPA: hypothetical protein VFP71_15230, partial [Candidatus Angelobacter sp.]|nr:hypothetical protein [Candidatus Angelobacter sp.]
TSIVQHEGSHMAYDQLTKGGKRVVTGNYETAETGIMIPVEEVPDLTGDNLYKKIDQIADDIARQTSQKSFKKLDEVLDEAGTGIDAKGQPITPELYLQGLERMEVSFDPDTLEPTFSIVIHPAMMPAMEKLKDQMENNPEYKKQYDALMARKREEWLDRESRRKLVD